MRRAVRNIRWPVKDANTFTARPVPNPKSVIATSRNDSLSIWSRQQSASADRSHTSRKTGNARELSLEVASDRSTRENGGTNKPWVKRIPPSEARIGFVAWKWNLCLPDRKVISPRSRQFRGVQLLWNRFSARRSCASALSDHRLAKKKTKRWWLCPPPWWTQGPIFSRATRALLLTT